MTAPNFSGLQLRPFHTSAQIWAKNRARRKFQLQFLPWKIVTWAIAGLVLLPLIALILIALRPQENIWPHLISTVLPRAALDTFLLMLGVGSFTLIIGAGTAWLVTMYRFAGQKIFSWLLVLPLALPTYLIAFCYVEFFDYSGTLQTLLRDIFGWSNARQYWFPDVRSLPGAIFVMSMVLFPYVYLTARASFIQQSVCALDVARTLGASQWRVFTRIALPLARPALAAGVALSLMECINDIGAVEYLGVNTLTVSAYTTWLERSSLEGAAQISCLLLFVVLLLFILERQARKEQKYHHTSLRHSALPENRLTGWRAGLAFCACLLPIVFGFIIPVGVLLSAALTHYESALSAAFWGAAKNSVILSLAAAFCAGLFALLLTYSQRLISGKLNKIIYRLASIGYAIPGTILAIGLLIPLAKFDNSIDSLMEGMFGISTGLLLSGSGFALILAYTIRFLAISSGALEAGFDKLSPNLDAAARSLGTSAPRTLFKVHIPILRPAIATALLLVFVDSMKELPATLLLRPFNFDTLATLIYNFASLDQFEDGAMAALTIVALGLVPVILLTRTISFGRAGEQQSH